MTAATLITAEEFLARPQQLDGSGNPVSEELIEGESLRWDLNPNSMI